jgi:molecular chaperone GrpE
MADNEKNKNNENNEAFTEDAASEEDVMKEEIETEEEDEAQKQAKLDSLQAEIEAKENLIKEYSDRMLRLQADFDNFRRRTKQEKEEISVVVVQRLIGELLPVVDNMERALASDHGDGAALKAGIEMVYKQLMDTLAKNGMEVIKAAGEKFDPNFHQAVMREQSADAEEDTILDELQRGYLVGGKVIRPSMVKVASN